MNAKQLAKSWLFCGIAYFLIFTYGMEFDRNYWIWIWLLVSQICFLLSLRFWIFSDNE